MPVSLKAVQPARFSTLDLSNGERAVALYASDMPTSYRYRKGDDERLCAWIAQGAARLGLENLAYIAAVQRDHRLDWMNGITTEEESAEGFSDEARRNRTGELASLVTFYESVSSKALRRQAQSAASLRPASMEVAA
ncbi:hypothetical protein [Streptomyces goshikiensis]|uniref:hypothetical protein n=1 Tax=Streptomyces goshikiensis TaxID=1942 RepID=UPI0038253CB3